MKICHVVPWFPSSNPITPESRQGLFEFRHVNSLIKRGHEFNVISVKWQGQSSYEYINDNLTIHRVPCIFRFPNIRYVVPNFYTLLNSIRDICDRWHPDLLVYSHTCHPIALSSLYVRRKKNIPLIAVSDGLPGISWFYGDRFVDFIGKQYSKYIERRIFKRADSIHFLTSELCKYSSFLGVDDSKVFALSRGVDTEKFKPRNCDPLLRSELGIEETDLVILYVGRLDTVKGVEYLLTAARRLIESDKHIKLLIVGEGRLRTYYEKASEDFKENIRFTGFKDDIPKLMNCADLFVLPSISEGSANVVLEASSSGLPVVASAVGEIPNIILEGKTGMLVKPRDPNSLYTAMRYLIYNRDLMRMFGLSGRQRIEQLFSCDAISQQLENKYIQVIQSHRMI